MIDENRLEDEQRTAKNTLGRNVSLSAGAGTGKTTTLTARYVHILESEIVDLGSAVENGTLTQGDAIERAASLPRRILTTTFTKRAAADLTAKIREEVDTRLADTSTERMYELWCAVRDTLDEAYIHNLHSLCVRLLKEHAVASPRTLPSDSVPYGLGVSDLETGFEVADEDEEAALVDEVVAATLWDRKDSDAVRTLTRRFDRSRVTQVLVDLLRVTPRSHVYDWLSSVRSFDSPEEYADALLELTMYQRGTSIDDVLAVWPEIADEVQLVYELRNEVSGNPKTNLIEPLSELVESEPYRLHGQNRFEDLAEDERIQFILELSTKVRKKERELYNKSWLLPKKYLNAVDDETDSFRGTNEYRVLDAAWHIATTVSTAWAKLGGVGFGQDERSYEYVTAFADLAERALKRLTEEKRTRNIVGYGDQIALARQFLTSLSAAERTELGFLAGPPNEGVAADVADLNAYVMIDEFQDTNADQWAVIEALTSTGDGGFDARNVFLVGDDKQSIYRFRGADVSVFSETTTQLTEANARNDITDPAKLDSLHTNFRTLPETLGAINGLFDRIFAPPDAVSSSSESDDSEEAWYTTIDDQPAPYEARSDPLTAARVNETGIGQRIEPVVEYIPVPTTQEQRDALLPEDHDLVVEGEENDAIEARVLANRIAKMLTDGTEVYEPINENHPDYEALQRGEDDTAPVERPRSIRPGDIAVLVPSRTQLSAYRRALRDVRVPHTVIKGSGFFETPEIKTLHTLVRVLANPRDDINLYGLLRSPIFGCTDTELAELALEGDGVGGWRLWDGLREAEPDRWASIHADIKRFRNYAGARHEHPSPDVSWADLITRVIDETGYLASVAADERGQTAVANVDEFRERMRGFDEAGVHSLAEVRYRLDQQAERATNDPEANFVAETGDDESDLGSVSILTIHESKGMEYKAVFVPGIGRNFNSAATARLDKAIEFEVVPDGSGKTIPVFGMDGPDPDDPYVDTKTIAKSLASEQRKREERAEQKRLLYVACTRARDHLVLLSRQASKKDDDYPAAMKPPSPTSATHWRDWVQAVLFDAPDSGDDAGLGAEAAVARLVENGRYDRELTFTSATGETKHGSFGVVLPPTDHTYDSASTRVDLQLEDHASYAAERPVGEDAMILSLSSSDCTQLDSGRIVADGTRYRIERDDDYTGSGSHDFAIPGGLSPNVYGTVVHRLCQLTPPNDALEDFVAQVLLEERQRGEDVDTDPDVQAIAEQAQATATRALAQIDAAIEGLDVQRRFDEYPVDVAFRDTGTLPVGRVELTGEIDHLVVTPDAYYVFDYKTDRLGRESDVETFISDRTTHHTPQMAAYAAALTHGDPERAVHTHLVFVDDVLGYRVEPVSLGDPLDSFFTMLEAGFKGRHDDAMTP